MSVLSKPQILKHLKGGNIVIDPFEEKNLNSTSYDVRIGKYIFRQTNLSHTQVLNPFYEKSVRAMYSKLEIAAPVENISSKTNPLYNLEPNDLIVLIAPGETILAHSIEFVGGSGKTGTPTATAWPYSQYASQRGTAFITAESSSYGKWNVANNTFAPTNGWTGIEYTYGVGHMAAPYNWWGTTDAAAIA